MKKRYYGLVEASKMLKIMPTELYRLVKMGFVPYRVINDCVLFDDEDIEIIKFYLKLRWKRFEWKRIKRKIIRFMKKRKEKEGILQQQGLVTQIIQQEDKKEE